MLFPCPMYGNVGSLLHIGSPGYPKWILLSFPMHTLGPGWHCNVMLFTVEIS